MNLLYFRASIDYEFLSEALGEVAKTDHLVKEALDIMSEVIREGGYKRQPMSVNWMRAVSSAGLNIFVRVMNNKYINRKWS